MSTSAFISFLAIKPEVGFFLSIIPYMFVRKPTIVRRMSGPSKNFGVPPVLLGSGDKADLSHLKLKSRIKGLPKILLHN